MEGGRHGEEPREETRESNQNKVYKLKRVLEQHLLIRIIFSLLIQKIRLKTLESGAF